MLAGPARGASCECHRGSRAALMQPFEGRGGLIRYPRVARCSQPWAECLPSFQDGGTGKMPPPRPAGSFAGCSSVVELSSLPDSGATSLLFHADFILIRDAFVFSVCAKAAA